MGIILGPLMLFWVGASIYTLLIGYELLGDKAPYLYVFSVLATAIVAMLVYAYAGLSRFRRKDSLWAFEIPFFFTARPIPFLVFMIALLLHIFAGEYIANEYVKLVPFMIMFTISFGINFGSFSANSYMARHNINKTY